MNEAQKVQYLVVDTSAFIQNASLQNIGVNIITEEDVVAEITNKRQLRNLVVLPYDLKIQNAYSENIKFVTEFAKKTGDYTSLSATDIKVIALTYQLEKEKGNIDHLRSAPIVAETVNSSTKKAADLHLPLAGFYVPDKEKKEKKISEDDRKVEVNVEDIVKNTEHEEEGEEASQSYFSDSSQGIDHNSAEDLCLKFLKLRCKSTMFVFQYENNTKYNVDDVLVPVTRSSDAEAECYDDTRSESEENYSDGDDDDDSGWITPGNICNIKKELNSELFEQKFATVACLTMDFAMQNVLKQIGLNLVTLDGKIIKKMRTYIFRCYACFKTTSIMTKVFCPNCGNKTLKRVTVTLSDKGEQKIHINFRKPISKKGKRFSLPIPKGGKHASNPILVEDQPLPDQRPSRLARMKNDPLQDEYIAGYSPFITRDVYSKSAILGIRPGGSVKYWMKKNPNECRGRRK